MLVHWCTSCQGESAPLSEKCWERCVTWTKKGMQIDPELLQKIDEIWGQRKTQFGLEYEYREVSHEVLSSGLEVLSGDGTGSGIYLTPKYGSNKVLSSIHGKEVHHVESFVHILRCQDKRIKSAALPVLQTLDKMVRELNRGATDGQGLP